MKSERVGWARRRRLGKCLLVVVGVMTATLAAAPQAGAAVSFGRTDYPLPSLTGPPPRTSNVGPGYYDDGPVALVDLNKDSNLDIVIADYGTGRADVLLNQGSGTFAAAPGSPFAACDSNLEARDIVAGQLDPQTDQNPDVAVVCDSGDGSGVGPGIVRLSGDGSGSLGPPQTFFRGAGSGGVGTPLKIGHVSGSSGGDFLYGNGPGYACFIPVTSPLLTGTPTCDGSVAAASLTPVHFYDSLCFAGDEMLSFSASGYNAFTGSALIPGPGPTNCSAPFSSSDRSSGIVGPNQGTAIAAADLNGDGEPDVVMADSGGAFHVTAWQGASTDFAGGIPPGAQPSDFTSAGPIYSIKAADFNGDGLADIAASEAPPSSSNVVAIHLGHGNASQFDAAQTFTVAGDSGDLPKMAVGDLNGDGKPDIVTTAGYAGAASVLLNATSPPTTTPPATAPTTKPSNIFSIAKPKLNEKKGTAKLVVEVPGPGTLTLAGKGVVTQRPALAGARGQRAAKTVGAAGPVTLLIKAKGKTKKKLNSSGKAKVKVQITFVPTGGDPNTQSKTVKLVKKP